VGVGIWPDGVSVAAWTTDVLVGACTVFVGGTFVAGGGPGVSETAGLGVGKAEVLVAEATTATGGSVGGGNGLSTV
jgi:hypothetical protein